MKLTDTVQGIRRKACRAATLVSVSTLALVIHRPITELLVTALPALPIAFNVTRMICLSSLVELEQSVPMLALKMDITSATAAVFWQLASLSQILCTMAEIPSAALDLNSRSVKSTC